MNKQSKLYNSKEQIPMEIRKETLNYDKENPKEIQK